MGNLRKVAEFYKALADETRLTILGLLADQELCACEIIAKLGLSQPAVSHHLKILRQAELINDSKEGKWVYYSLNPDVFTKVFPGATPEVLQSYAMPLLAKVSARKPSSMRNANAVCFLEGSRTDPNVEV